MKRILLILVLLGVVGEGAYLLMRRRTKAPVPQAPPFAAWVEATRDAKSGALRLDIYPLARIGDWKDISLDPDEEKQGWEQLPLDSFPLKARPVLETSRMGRSLGPLNVSAVEAQEVACNALVLGRGAWMEKAHAPAREGEAFLALWRGPAQSDWRPTISDADRAVQESAFLDQARQALGLGSDAQPESRHWGWFGLGAKGGNGAVGSVVFKAGDKLQVWNAAFLLPAGAPTQLAWSEQGNGSSEGDEDAMDASTLEFLDAADLDGDGVPELILRRSGYESYDFEILRFKDGRAEIVYQGSGYGC